MRRATAVCASRNGTHVSTKPHCLFRVVPRQPSAVNRRMPSFARNREEFARSAVDHATVSVADRWQTSGEAHEEVRWLAQPQVRKSLTKGDDLEAATRRC